MNFFTPLSIFFFLACCLISELSSAQSPPVKEIKDTLTLEQVLQKYPHTIPSYANESSGVRDDRPNIIFVMVDDERWDDQSVNGAPSFFQTPNIDRIANEGVNFKNFFAVNSLCSPSRSSFYTGLYPNKHKVVNNAATMQRSIPWISEILQNAGYYTVLAGKLAFNADSVRGFDDYMIAITESYDPAKYSIWAGDIAIHVVVSGHTTDLLTQYAIGKMMTRPANRPFFLYLAHRAPHVPYRPRTQDANLFTNEIMPYANASKYTKNFPSYYYPYNQAGDSLQQDSNYRGYFRMLMGVEETFGELTHYLDSVGIIDKTVIMYASDNGDIKSEHLLQGKQLPQEESIHLPMFLRYPVWFPQHVDLYNEIGINVDWAPTILDAAQIPNIYHMDGVSLRALAKHEVHRDAFMYEVWQENETPSMRAVRTQYYKYIYSFCDNTTEQLFDLVNDHQENINLINDPAYQVLAQYYRCKLDSFRRMLNDSAFIMGLQANKDTIYNSNASEGCKLKNADSSHVGASLNPGPIGTCTLSLLDADTTINIFSNDVPYGDQIWDVTVFNIFGEVITSMKRYYSALPANQLVLSKGLLLENENLAPGIYFAQFSNKNSRMTRKIIAL